MHYHTGGATNISSTRRGAEVCRSPLRKSGDPEIPSAHVLYDFRWSQAFVPASVSKPVVDASSNVRVCIYTYMYMCTCTLHIYMILLGEAYT